MPSPGNYCIIPDRGQPEQEILAAERWRQSTSWAVASAESLSAGRDKALFRRFKENQIQVLGGNKQLAVNVANGKLAFGIADTDDAPEIRGGRGRGG